MTKKDSWVKFKPNEVKKLVLKYAKQGNAPSMIGMILRDEYGIPDVKNLVGLSIVKVLEEANFKMELPEELRALIKKSLDLRAHLENNVHDQPSKRSLSKTEARIRAKSAYFKKRGKLALDWKYEPERIKLLLN